MLSHYVGLAYKQRAHKVEVELDGSREQEKMLSDQVGGLLVILLKQGDGGGNRKCY